MLIKEELHRHQTFGTPHQPLISATGQRLRNPQNQSLVHLEDRKESGVLQRPHSWTSRTPSGGGLAGPGSTVSQLIGSGLNEFWPPPLLFYITLVVYNQRRRGILTFSSSIHKKYLVQVVVILQHSKSLDQLEKVLRSRKLHIFLSCFLSWDRSCDIQWCYFSQLLLVLLYFFKRFVGRSFSPARVWMYEVDNHRHPFVPVTFVDPVAGRYVFWQWRRHQATGSGIHAGIHEGAKWFGRRAVISPGGRI